MASDPLMSTIIVSSGRRRVPLWAFAALAVIQVGLMTVPRAQATFFPVLGVQQINPDRVVRTAGRMLVLPDGLDAGRRRWIGATLCWERLGKKNYVAPISNFDVFLDRRNYATNAFDDTRRTFPEVWFEQSHDPVETDTAPGLGVTRRRLCINLPTKVRPDQPIRLQQFVHFKGLWGLWDLPPTPLPEIVSHGATVAPDAVP